MTKKEFLEELWNRIYPNYDENDISVILTWSQNRGDYINVYNHRKERNVMVIKVENLYPDLRSNVRVSFIVTTDLINNRQEFIRINEFIEDERN